MRRRAVLALPAGVLLARGREALTQQAGKPHRIGFLRPGAPPEAWIEAFRAGLRERGQVEGVDYLVDYRFTDGSYGPLPRLAAELIERGAEVIVASAGPATLAARDATASVPVVFVGVYDPTVAGLVASLARPGGNLTGLSQGAVELFGKHLELLRELVPRLNRAAIVWNSGNPINRLQLSAAESAARTAGFELQAVPVQSPDDFDAAFAAAQVAEGLIQTADPFLTLQRARLVALAMRHRMPAVYSQSEFVDAGGLMSYGPDLADLYRRAASYVDRILKGAKPGDLPVEQPTKYELLVNLGAARALGLEIPPSILTRADRVIE